MTSVPQAHCILPAMNRSFIASLALESPPNSNLGSLMVGSSRKGKNMLARPGADSLVTSENPRPLPKADSRLLPGRGQTPCDLRKVTHEASIAQCKRQAQAELVKKTFAGAYDVTDQMARLKELVKVLGVQKDKPPSRQQAQPQQTKAKQRLAEPVKLSLCSMVAGMEMEDQESCRNISKNSSLSGRSTSMSLGDVPDCASSTCPSEPAETISENGSIRDDSEVFDSRMEPMKIDFAATCFAPPPGLGYPGPYLQQMQGPMPLYVEPSLGGRCMF